MQAAKQLIRERGYHATAFSDILELSKAPRGSVYFHFPGGKTQLTMEAAAAHVHEQIGIIDGAAAHADSRHDSSRSMWISPATRWRPAATRADAEWRRW